MHAPGVIHEGASSTRMMTLDDAPSGGIES